jgi:hypothetical protein
VVCNTQGWPPIAASASSACARACAWSSAAKCCARRPSGSSDLRLAAIPPTVAGGARARARRDFRLRLRLERPRTLPTDSRRVFVLRRR